MRNPDDFREEIRAHVELEADRLRDQGLSPEQARAAAQRSFGNVAAAEERYYESRRWVWLDLLAQNLRFGFRMLKRNPGSSLVAILTLALGIGANTAIFSLLNVVLLRNLPVRQPDQLVLFGTAQWGGSVDDLPNRNWHLFSYSGYRYFQAKNQVYSDVAAIDSLLFGTHGRVGSSAGLENISVELVSGTYFQTLGVSPGVGRVLADSDDAEPGAHPVAVASYSWWQRRLAMDPSAVGSTVTIGSTVYTIIGVAPRNFTGMTIGHSPDLWIPLAMEKEISPGWHGREEPMFQSLYVVARRKPGVGMEQASANTNLLFHQIALGYAGPNPTPKQLAETARAHVQLTPAATGFSQLRRRVSSPLKILMAVVAVVLLIACANVANLLLAKATARQREIAVRMSIGAGRGRLIVQLLIESGMLGLAGAMLSVPLAWALLRFLISAGTGALPLEIAPDTQVLGFALAVTMLTVLLFGAVPAFRATRVDLASSLKGRGVVGSAPRNRLARGLIAGQVALSLALLAGAGLFLRSLINLMNVDTGFDKRNVLVTDIDPGSAGYRPDARLQDLMARVEKRVGAIRGIEAASFSLFVFNEGEMTDTVTVVGRAKSDHDPEVDQSIVGSQFLDAMKMRLILGRKFNERDTANSQKVAVINETMARVYFAGASPIGRTFSVGDSPKPRDMTVVGVVQDAKYDGLEEKPRPAAFYPHSQRTGFANNFVVRYSGDPKILIPEIRRAFAEVDPNLPVSDFWTLAKMVDDSVQTQRLVAQLSSLFGALAAMLACIGIYGVMSYGIARRTNEFGIRMALGAQRNDVLWMVLREALGLVLLGVAAGLALALMLSRLVTSMLFGLSPTDPLAIGLAAALMIAVALFAGWIPARRATRIDPTVALRYE
jgi:predicted permease